MAKKIQLQLNREDINPRFIYKTGVDRSKDIHSFVGAAEVNSTYGLLGTCVGTAIHELDGGR